MRANRFVSKILVITICLSAAIQQTQAQQRISASSKTNSAGAVSNANLSNLIARVLQGRQAGFSFMPSNRYASARGSVFNTIPAAMSVSPPAILGNGTVGQISLWSGTGPSGNSILGDSIITQLNGNIGIGLATPMSKLSVQGMIETTLGGYKFPDGTVQTTAAVSGLQSVAHDTTLTGDGTSGSPLGVSVPLSLSRSSPDAILTIQNFCCIGLGGEGVNTRGGDNFSGQGGNGIRAIGGRSNTGSGGNGVSAFGGSGSGPGVRAVGGIGEGIGSGGDGVRAFGGNSESILAAGGIGVNASGGASGSVGDGPGGIGIQSVGGFSTTQGGRGLVATGGESLRAFGGDNIGGSGIVATGGNARTTNLEGDTRGGDGVVAIGGNASDAFFGTTFPGSGLNATGGNSDADFGGIGVFATGGISRNSAGLLGAGGVGLVATGGSGNPSGRAALFRGNVDINGNLDVSGPAGGGNITATGSKNFKIDHPLDPENKYLLHASVESSEVLNVYSGNVTTDPKGEAVVTLPDWFEALNRDLRYQLTVIGTFAQAIVGSEVQTNRFTIKTNAPNVKVSWQVTGVRSDRMMQKHPFRAVEDKPERERGTYLIPELFGKPEERGAEWARNPELMKRLQHQRHESQQIAGFIEKKGVGH
jgi:hypothetical protein